MLEKNTKQVNSMIARMLGVCTVIILLLVVCSWVGFFEFGKEYTRIILLAGLVITISPGILIRYMSDNTIKYYMLFILAIFIGVLGTNNHIGIYITYVLVPIFSCLYFEPRLVVQTSVFSYVVMAVSLYINTAGKYEVIYEKRDHFAIFMAYLLGFTMEYLVVNSILYLIVKQAKKIMEERYSAQEESRMKSKLLSEISHEVRTPMNAVIGMSEIALRKEEDEQLQTCFKVIISSSKGLLEVVNEALGADPDISKLSEKNEPLVDTDSFQTKDAHILIVDDNALNREVLKELFEPIELNIDEAEDGKQAVEMCRKISYDLIFMDSHMPVMNGEEATQQIRMNLKGANGNTPIIALTADAVKGVKERLLLCGMNDYIVKPVDIKAIYRILATYLPKEKIVSHGNS